LLNYDFFSKPYYKVLHGDGSVDMDIRTTIQTKPVGDLAAFEIENQMQVLGQGTVNLWPILLDTDGIQVPDGTVNALRVTGNEVAPTVSANGATGLTPAEDALIVINEPAQFSIAVQGPAEMSHYEVRWRYFIWQETGWPTGWVVFDRHDGAAVTSFSGASISTNPVTLTDPADFNRKLKVEFDICRRYDGTVVYSGVFDRLRSIVKGERLFLATRTADELYRGNNYFLFRGLNTLAPAVTSQNLQLRLDLGDDGSIVVPFSDTVQGLLYGTEGAASQDLGTITLYDTHLYLSLSTIDACGRIDLGIFELNNADQDSLLSQAGLVVKRTNTTPMTTIDVNLFRVDYRETALGPMYVIKGCAPTPLDSFKARWTFFDGATVETPFTPVGLIQESLTPMNKGLQQVQIINPLGIPVAQAGFLSASTSTYPDRVSREIRTRYEVATEYRYREAAQGYAGQLTSLAKHGAYEQFELDFQFPDGFSRVLVKTVNDIDGAPLPVVENVAVTAQSIAFDAIMPSAGYYTTLTVLEAPAYGTLVLNGIHAAYTPTSGFSGTDRFVIGIDGRVCDIEPDAIYYHLEGEIEYSGIHPVVRFTQVFTPFYSYGPCALGITFMDAEGQLPTTGVVTPPEAAEQLIVEATEGGVGITTSSLPANTDHEFILGVAIPGGSSGNVAVNLRYYSNYPEFFAYRNQDFVIPPMMVLHRFFEFYETGAHHIKDIWVSPASGQLLLNGEPLDLKNLLSAADLNNLVFRPATDYVGPTTLYFYGSEDGETWSSQRRIGGMVLSAEGLSDIIQILQILAGYSVYPAETSPVGDRDGDNRIGLAEVLYQLHRMAE